MYGVIYASVMSTSSSYMLFKHQQHYTERAVFLFKVRERKERNENCSLQVSYFD